MTRFANIYLAKWKLLLLVGDVGVFCLSILAGVFFSPKTGEVPLQLIVEHKFSVLLVGIVYLLVLYIADLYDYQLDFRRWVNIGKLTLSAWLGTLVVVTLFYFPLGAFIGRTLLIIQASVFFLLLALWRFSFSAVALPQRLQRQVLIMGAGKAGRRILAEIRRRPGCGLGVIGFTDDDPQKIGTEIEGLPVLGSSGQLPKLAGERRVTLVVVAITHEKSANLITNLAHLSWSGCQVMDMPSLYEFLAGRVPTEHISDLWLSLTGLHDIRFYYPHLKRLVDLVLAAAGLLITLPLFALIALLIKLDRAGPVFFRQERLGQDAKPFQILKFRTMVRDAEPSGPRWADEADPRVTRVGRLLRKLRLDELPQLVNIIKGDMSFIGPRPEREAFIKELKEKVPYYGYRFLVKPGLTGWAQVMYPYASSLNQSQEKLEYDIYYIKNMGFFLDLAILLKTVRIVLFGRGQ
jgi:exopolysaccharide biosynthesis polyprenyl glycosylphosphotransferase